VLGHHGAAPGGYRRDDEVAYAEVIERKRDAEDVGDGVGRADLVEVHLVGLHVVHEGLGPGHDSQRVERAVFHLLGQRRRLEQLAQLGPVSARGTIFGDAEAYTGDAARRARGSIDLHAL